MSRAVTTTQGFRVQCFAQVNNRGEVIREGPTPPKTSSGGSSGCLILLVTFLFLARALAGLLPDQPPGSSFLEAFGDLQNGQVREFPGLCLLLPAPISRR